jgi:broad specificity phosphatase PhoE
VRHGERLDDIAEKDRKGIKITYPYDPPLSSRGKEQA